MGEFVSFWNRKLEYKFLDIQCGVVTEADWCKTELQFVCILLICKHTVFQRFYWFLKGTGFSLPRQNLSPLRLPPSRVRLAGIFLWSLDMICLLGSLEWFIKPQQSAVEESFSCPLLAGLHTSVNWCLVTSLLEHARELCLPHMGGYRWLMEPGDTRDRGCVKSSEWSLDWMVVSDSTGFLQTGGASGFMCLRTS